ncbi:MAG: YraN family protein, partial [Bacteroidota bacterium]
MGKHNEFGKLGEQIAADFLMNNGYSILARNLRYQKAEIDILASKGGILAVVEVKSRTSGFLVNLNEVVNQKKIGLLVNAADSFVQEHNLDEEVRFDLITVVKTKDTYKVE